MWCLKNVITGETRCIFKSEFKVGRNVRADITSKTESLSRRHATLSVLVDGCLYVQDNKSCNGTFVNDQRINPMEMKLLKEGDVVAFGYCEEIHQNKKIPTPPVIYKVLKKQIKPANDISEQTEESKKSNGEFSPIPDCIVISDEEDDDLFNNSQIFKISEKIKSELSNCNDSIDPYYNIKQELEDLDFCDNNQYVVDITDEDNCFDKTSDLLDILESPKQSIEPKALPSEQKYTKPPIIEPHFVKQSTKQKELPASGSSKASSDNSGKIQRKSKRKSSVSSPHVKKRARSCGYLQSACDTDSTMKEHRRSISKSPSEKNKCSKESKVTILEDPRKKLKEIATSNQSSSCTKEKTVKHEARVKLSAKRGTFSLKANSTKSLTKPELLPSTSKCSVKQDVRRQSKDIIGVQDTAISSNIIPNTTSNDHLDGLVIIKSTPKTFDISESDSMAGMIWKMNANGYNTFKNTHRNINIDDAICKIVHWSVKWLMEQNSIDRSPPVNGEVQPKRMPLHFTSFSEYSLIVTSLVILELWQYVYQMLYNKDEERSPIKLFVNHKRIVGRLIYLDCECYMSKESVTKNVVPRIDDFVLIELKLKDSENCYMYTGFGYIKFCKRKYLSENMTVDNHIASLCSETPNISLTLSIVIRNLTNKEIIGNHVIIKVIGNINTSLRSLRSVKCLEMSPLCKNILHPKVEDFNVSCSQDQSKNLIVEVNLNKEQKEIVLEACRLCLGNVPKLYLIKGPPGTGKSTVIINIVLQIILSSIRDNTKESPVILLTAPSNTAVDGLILKLAEVRQKLTEAQRKHVRMIRLGPESSISPNVDKYKLSTLARNYILKELRLTTSEKYKRAMREGVDVDQFLRNHLGHNYYYETRSAEDILLYGSNIVCTTLNSCVGTRILEARKRDQLRFSCCIIDEATQCCEPESLLPLQLGIDKIVLVGDPQQLSAVVCNKEALDLGYGKSLFLRIEESFKKNANNPVRMLREQYRMHPEICEYPNKTFYNGYLKSFPIHTNRIVPKLQPYLLLNLLGTDHDDKSSYTNSQEVQLLSSLLRTLKRHIKANCKYTIGIITPYKAQKELIVAQISGIIFNENVSITVNTVDSFQGMENDIIIISCVRFTPNYFLQNAHRLNVALTRARQALYIIGNYSLFKHCPLLYDLREDAKKRRLCFDIKEVSKDIDFAKYIFKL